MLMEYWLAARFGRVWLRLRPGPTAALEGMPATSDAIAHGEEVPTVGSFLTGAPPASADQAVAGLALPPANTAEFIQEVMVPAGTRLQSSIASPAFGQPGGMLQFELLERIPIKNFGEGVPFG